jgi:hypothetical protein
LILIYKNDLKTLKIFSKKAEKMTFHHGTERNMRGQSNEPQSDSNLKRRRRSLMKTKELQSR